MEHNTCPEIIKSYNKNTDLLYNELISTKLYETTLKNKEFYKEWRTISPQKKITENYLCALMRNYSIDQLYTIGSLKPDFPLDQIQGSKQLYFRITQLPVDLRNYTFSFMFETKTAYTTFKQMPYAYGLFKYASLTRYIQHHPHNFSLDTYYAASPTLGKIYKKLYESFEKNESPILSEQEEYCIQQEMPINIARPMKFFHVHCSLPYKKRLQKVLYDSLTHAAVCSAPIMITTVYVCFSVGGQALAMRTFSKQELLDICRDDPCSTRGSLLLLMSWIPCIITITGICGTIKALDSWQEAKHEVVRKTIGSIKQLST
jgi:hypothetical protein